LDSPEDGEKNMKMKITVKWSGGERLQIILNNNNQQSQAFIPLHAAL
jgi:hypothetical protein